MRHQTTNGKYSGMSRNIETRLDRLEGSIGRKTETMKYSPEEKALLKECASREAQIELKYLNGMITDEERDTLIEQAPIEVAKEMGLEQVQENLMRRIDHE
jgi:hypothetical protein